MSNIEVHVPYEKQQHIKKERKKYWTEIHESWKTQPNTHLVAHSFRNCCAGWECSSCTSAGPRQRHSASGCTRAGVATYPTSPCSSASCRAALWPRCWSACRTTTPFKVSITTSRSACRTTTQGQWSLQGQGFLSPRLVSRIAAPSKVSSAPNISVQYCIPFHGQWLLEGQE